MKQATSLRSIAVMVAAGAVLLTGAFMDVSRLSVHADETTVSTKQVSEAETGVEAGVVAVYPSGDRKATDVFDEDDRHTASADRENSMFETQPEDEPETKSTPSPLLIFIVFAVGFVAGALIVTALSMSAERVRAANRAQSMSQISESINRIKDHIEQIRIGDCTKKAKNAVTIAKMTNEKLQNIESEIGQ